MALQDQFTRLLGREPRQDELDFFKKFIDQGELTEFEVGQILQSTPEFQQTQLRTQGQELGQQLAQGDERILGRAADQIQSRFRRQGRAGSSGESAQFAQTAGNLAAQRQQQLAGFFGQGLGGIRQLGVQQGLGAQERGFGVRSDLLNRSRQLEDFRLERQSFEDQLSTQNRRNRQNAFLQAGLNLPGQLLGAFGGKK